MPRGDPGEDEQLHFHLQVVVLTQQRLLMSMKYVVKMNIIFENQFGFRSGYSTVQAVTLITDKSKKQLKINNTLVSYF